MERIVAIGSLNVDRVVQTRKIFFSGGEALIVAASGAKTSLNQK